MIPTLLMLLNIKQNWSFAFKGESYVTDRLENKQRHEGETRYVVVYSLLMMQSMHTYVYIIYNSWSKISNNLIPIIWFIYSNDIYLYYSNFLIELFWIDVN